MTAHFVVPVQYLCLVATFAWQVLATENSCLVELSLKLYSDSNQWTATLQSSYGHGTPCFGNRPLDR